jgi:hypothetical protein
MRTLPSLAFTVYSVPLARYPSSPSRTVRNSVAAPCTWIGGLRPAWTHVGTVGSHAWDGPTSSGLQANVCDCIHGAVHLPRSACKAGALCSRGVFDSWFGLTMLHLQGLPFRAPSEPGLHSTCRSSRSDLDDRIRRRP